jgi:hypothetical protein
MWGDVRHLQGRVIEVHGPVKEYDGRAEIIRQEYRQLGGPPAGRMPRARRRHYCSVGCT